MAAFAMAMLVCSDLARSRAFYRDVLSLRVATDALPHWGRFRHFGRIAVITDPDGYVIQVDSPKHAGATRR